MLAPGDMMTGVLFTLKSKTGRLGHERSLPKSPRAKKTQGLSLLVPGADFSICSQYYEMSKILEPSIIAPSKD